MSVKISIGKVSQNISRIGRFLFKIYIEECKWKFGQTTPSELRLSKDDFGNDILVDKFMETAIWALAFDDNDDIIGCVRLIDGATEDDIELFGYRDRSETIQEIKEDNINKDAIEINRLAISFEHRGKNIFPMMVCGLAKWLKKNKKDVSLVFTIADSKNLDSSALIYYSIRLGFRKYGNTFKYEDNDPYPVQVFLGNSDTLVNKVLAWEIGHNQDKDQALLKSMV